MKVTITLAVVVVLFLVVGGCNKSELVRTYKEVQTTSIKPAAEDPHSKLPMAPGMNEAANPHAGTNSGFAWKVPEGWTEKTASGMRIGSFIFERDGLTADCSIIPLSGAAGGLRQNVERWFGQLGQTPDVGMIDMFIAKAETMAKNDSLTLKIFDYTAVTKADDQQSMLAAVLEMNDRTIFIKCVGAKKLLSGQLPAFRQFCGSFQVGG